jgi:hypothetical protein
VNTSREYLQGRVRKRSGEEQVRKQVRKQVSGCGRLLCMNTSRE